MACHVHLGRGAGREGFAKLVGGPADVRASGAGRAQEASPLASLSKVFQWGKRWRVHRQTLLMQNYEKPCFKRTRIAEENAYYPRWFYLKYTTEVLKFSLKK